MHFMSPAGNGSRFRNRISPAVLELGLRLPPQSPSSELNIQAFRTGASFIAIDEHNAPPGLMESAAPTSELHFITAIRGGS